ncbi:MAG TPA: hypothetical protein VF814_20125 [Casimicrobiaceae bacterium]
MASTQGYVKRYGVGCTQQKHAVLERELARILDPRGESAKKRINVASLVAQSREHGQVGVASQACFAPMLDGDSVDEAEAPPTTTAELLDFLRRFEQSVRAAHGHASKQTDAASRSARRSGPEQGQPTGGRRAATCRTLLDGTAPAIALQAPSAAAAPACDPFHASARRAVCVGSIPRFAKCNADGATPDASSKAAPPLGITVPQALLMKAGEVIH